MLRKQQLADRNRAESLTTQVKEQVSIMRCAWVGFALLIDQCQREQVPAALGLTMTNWLRSCGVEGRARRAMRALKALRGIPEPELKKIGEGNAVTLARLPETERKKKSWIGKAQDLPTKEFRAVVTDILQRKYGFEAEEWETVKIRVTKEVAGMLEAAVQRTAKIFSIDIVEKPERRIECWKYIAGLIDGLKEETIKAIVTGE